MRSKRRYNAMSDAGKSLATRAKRYFQKNYPDVKVGIDTREGWITVDGKKAVNMSSASRRPMDLEDVTDLMKQAYLDHPMHESTVKITRHQLRRIIKEAGGFRDYSEDEIEYTSRAGTVGETQPEYQDLPQSDDDYYEQRIQDEREELYLEDLSTLKGIVEKYGAVDMQRIMGDAKKERYLRRYDFDDIRDMLTRLQRDDEIDYDEESRQWVAV